MTIVGNQSKQPLPVDGKVAVVFGGAGFIGHHLARRLKKEGYWVRIVDIKAPEFSGAGDVCDDVIVCGDLQTYDEVFNALDFNGSYNIKQVNPDKIEIFQLAADMGGAGYIFSGNNDAHVMHNSALINLHTLQAMVELGIKKVFYSSSACVYPEFNQTDPDNPKCDEDSAYPAQPDSEYGWEKLFSERLYQAYHRNHGIECRIARFHNVYGPEGTWTGGREKAPAAVCRKVAMAKETDEIEIWGDGIQTRTFLYVDECVEGILRLMRSDYTKPLNIGSEEMISINDLAYMVADIAEKAITIKHIPGPLGVRGRSSDNKRIREVLGWEPKYSLKKGMEKTYRWILEQVKNA